MCFGRLVVLGCAVAGLQAAACGRIGYDPIPEVGIDAGPARDAGRDGAIVVPDGPLDANADDSGRDAASVCPAVVETCNGVDDDCDGAVDEAGAAIALCAVGSCLTGRCSLGGAPLAVLGVGDPSDNDAGWDIAFDAMGRPAVAGHYAGTVDFGAGPQPSRGDWDAFFVGYGGDLGPRWADQHGSLTEDLAYGIALRPSGAVAAVGYVTGGTMGLLWLGDDAGVETSTHLYASTAAVVLTDVAFGPAGNIYVTGAHTGTVTLGGDLFSAPTGARHAVVASFTADGAHRWSDTFGGDTSTDGLAIAVDGDASVYVVGYTDEMVDFGGGLLSNAGSRDAFIASFTTDGAHRWSQTHGGPGFDRCNGVAVNGSRVLVTGYFSGDASFGGDGLSSRGGLDVFVAAYARGEGAHLWARAFGETSDQIGEAIAVDDANIAFVTGSYSGGLDFGGGVIAEPADVDAFVASLGPNGEHRWSLGFGTSLSAVGYGIAVSPAGVVGVTGAFEGTFTLGTRNASSTGFRDAFVVLLED